MTTSDQLKQIFCDNFIAYFRSHVAHVNIMGRNFVSDHKLLQKIYEELQDQIDTIAELLRSMQEFMPNNMVAIMDNSTVPADPLDGDSEFLLTEIRNDLDSLKMSYETLIRVATDDGHDEIANYAQDRVLSLAKHIWMLDSTLS